jgi:FKBP-type peptidyl-prolyl cis-trans isomerase (trigger factor)
MERGIGAEDWLQRRGTTMTEMEEGWTKAAQSSVRIGLGLAEVAKQQGKELKNDQDYQELLDSLVSQS